MEHLQPLGDRRVGCLGGPTTSWPDSLRRKGPTPAPSALAIDLTVRVAGSTSDGGHPALPSLLEQNISALVTFNDPVAMGALSQRLMQGQRANTEQWLPSCLVVRESTAAPRT